MYLLEPLLSYLRLTTVEKYIKNHSIICDIGCGQSARLLHYIEERIDRGIGLDEVINSRKVGKLEFKTVNVNLEKLPMEKASVDVVTLLAVIEHVKHPQRLINEASEILKKGGQLILTTPSPKNEPLLNLLSQLRLVDPHMIEQHQTYFDLKKLKSMLIQSGLTIKEARTFEWGFNLLVVAQK